MKKGKKFETVNCKGCLKDFTVLSARVNAGNGKYCSIDCFKASRLKNKTPKWKVSRQYTAKWRYGVNEEEYNELMKVTNCAICNKELSSNSKEKTSQKCIDHCHTTKMIRGVLCHNCNMGLGYFKDNAEYLDIAAKYLLNVEMHKHPCQFAKAELIK